jgi:acylphosphatase
MPEPPTGWVPARQAEPGGVPARTAEPGGAPARTAEPGGAPARTAETVPQDGHGEVRLTAWVEGYVQGVGFRWWTRSQARRLGLRGTVANLPDGRVEVIAEGARSACAQLLTLLDGPETPGRVTGIDHRWGQARGEFAGFTAL